MSFKTAIYLLLSVGLFISSCQDQKKLPIYGHREPREVKKADGSTTVDTIYQTIPDFRFLNQDSTYITNETFKDKIYIADFFFTSCTSICPVMHSNMKTVFDEFKDNPDVMYLSHTIDFKYDTPSRLKKYAQKLGVDRSNWLFAYGSKDSIYTIAEKSYLVAVVEDSSNKEGYIHQGWFVLIDKQRRMRGIYEGTDKAQVAKLIKDIPVLLAEDKKK